MGVPPIDPGLVPELPPIPAIVMVEISDATGNVLFVGVLPTPAWEPAGGEDGWDGGGLPPLPGDLGDIGNVPLPPGFELPTLPGFDYPLPPGLVPH
jgi:hypothetical protein